MDAPQIEKLGFMMRISNALNEVHVNVWGVVLIGWGVALSLHHQEGTGQTLITGGFALIAGQKIAQTAGK